MEKTLPRGVYRRKDGGNLWISCGGRRESAGSPRLEDAKKLLAIRMAQRFEGKSGVIEASKVTFEDLSVIMARDYRVNVRKNIARLIGILGILHRFFCGKKATEITTRAINDYILWRRTLPTPRGEPPSNATINRELAALRRMLSLGAMETPPRVLRVPKFTRLAEAPPRKGFFTREEFYRLMAQSPDYLRLPVAVAYATGMRAGEIFILRWDQVDVGTGRLHLPRGTTKNLEGRIIYVPEEIRGKLEAHKNISQAEYPSCLFVFHRNGGPIRSYRGAWASACRKAGLEGRLFHDLRRTAIRNMVRAGVGERVAMAISGHKTRSVFDRYNIVSEGDLLMAAKAIGTAIDKKE